MKLKKVSFELAKKLKEIEFDEKCINIFTEAIQDNAPHVKKGDIKEVKYSNLWFHNTATFDDSPIHNYYARPTQALAQMWFLKEHKLDIVIYPVLNSEKKHIGYSFGIADLTTGETYSDFIVHNNLYKPDILEAGLLKACKIVKERQNEVSDS